MSTLNNFIAKIKSDGLAKANRFAVEFQPPVVVSGNYNLQSMLLYCSQVNLPGVNYNTNPAKIHGEVFEFPYEKLYSPVSMNFYVDVNMEIKNFFDQWHLGIQNNGNREFSYYDEYTTQINIMVQDAKNNNIYKVTLYEAYPKTINDINLDYSINGIMNLSINFAYKYFKVEQQAGIADNQKISASLFPDFSLSSIISGSIPDNYLNGFRQFQEGVTQYTQPFNNAKQAMSSFLAKSKDLIA